MQKQKIAIRIPIILICLLYLVIGCKTLQFKPKANANPIAVSLDLVNVIDDKVKVEIKVTNFTSDTISYYLPKIVPGTYQNNNYGKLVEDFQAFDKLGNLLSVEKHGFNRWKIKNASQLSSISYFVNDTFDNEDSHTIFSPTGSNIDQGKNFILNFYAFVGYFDGMQNNTYQLSIKHPKELAASTSVQQLKPQLPNSNAEYNIDHFKFNRYADLIDAPIMYTVPNKVLLNIKEIQILLSVYSPNNVYSASQLMPQMERVIRAQKSFLDSIDSTKKYSILLYLSPAKDGDAKGFGALEHCTSTVVVLPESIQLEQLNESLTDIVSHEFFHIVTPLSIHSKEIHDFDYNNPKMSKHLWLYEGTTEYFSLLFQVHQALITKEEFFERIIEKIKISKTYDDTMVFTEMSKNILKEPYLQNYSNVYEKGALISMCLDIIIRERTKGAKGIINLIQQLSNKFGPNIPFKDDKLFDIIRKLEYPLVADFLETHVANNTPIDYYLYLNKVGVISETKNIPAKYFLYGQESFIKGSDTTKEVVFTAGVSHHNFLSKVGIQGGDILISINTKEYTVKNIYDLFGDSNKWKIGDPIRFKIKRNGEVIPLTSTVTAPSVRQTFLTTNPNATELQTKALKGWIND